MKVMKIRELWIILVLGIVLITLLISENSFLEKYIILIVTSMCVIDLLILLIRVTLIRKRKIRESIIITSFKLYIIAYNFILSLIIFIFIMGGLMTSGKEYNNLLLYPLLVVYNMLTELINYICIKKQDLLLTEDGVIFPTGQYFAYSSMKYIESELGESTCTIHIDTNGAVGELRFYILSKDIDKIRIIEERILNQKILK
ncbi:hypothetical protein [Clostridium baratii]|uniref:hypothetical protein n=1 Tax=Clostridium baratii TaxID=1561 RepID=UPI0030CEC269